MSNDDTTRYVPPSIVPGLRFASLAAAVLVAGCVQTASDSNEITTAVKEYDETMNEKKTPKALPNGPGTTGRMRELTQQSQRDLAERLKINEDDVSIVEARHVIWPDSSAGCPTPGFNYLQVRTKGVLIRLQAGERIYQFHGSGSGPAFECKKPSPHKPQPLYEDR